MALNIERFKQLRDLLVKTHDEDFNMANWVLRPSGQSYGYVSAKKDGWYCGTSACLAGHVVLNLMTDDEIKHRDDHISKAAADWLGMNSWDQDSLFKGGGNSDHSNVPLNSITKKEAIKALDFIIENGRIPIGIFPMMRAGKL